MIQKWIFFCLLLVLSACDTTKKAANSGAADAIAETTKCKIPGTVKDYTGLDGCKFLIELENGQKWLPAEMEDTSFELKDGQRILFGFKEIKDAVSVCMAESKTIAVTCIKINDKGQDKPYVKKCADLEDPMSAEWMAEIVRLKKPQRINKYKFRDGWAYLISTKANRMLYDCQGTNLCPNETGDIRDCMTKYLPMLSESKEIYSIENIKGE